jgi:hypothetical protein
VIVICASTRGNLSRDASFADCCSNPSTAPVRGPAAGRRDRKRFPRHRGSPERRYPRDWRNRAGIIGRMRELGYELRAGAAAKRSGFSSGRRRGQVDAGPKSPPADYPLLRRVCSRMEGAHRPWLSSRTGICARRRRVRPVRPGYRRHAPQASWTTPRAATSEKTGACAATSGTRTSFRWPKAAANAIFQHAHSAWRHREATAACALALLGAPGLRRRDVVFCARQLATAPAAQTTISAADRR